MPESIDRQVKPLLGELGFRKIDAEPQDLFFRDEIYKEVFIKEHGKLIEFLQPGVGVEIFFPFGDEEGELISPRG